MACAVDPPAQATARPAVRATAATAHSANRGCARVVETVAAGGAGNALRGSSARGGREVVGTLRPGLALALPLTLALPLSLTLVVAALVAVVARRRLEVRGHGPGASDLRRAEDRVLRVLLDVRGGRDGRLALGELDRELVPRVVVDREVLGRAVAQVDGQRERMLRGGLSRERVARVAVLAHLEIAGVADEEGLPVDDEERNRVDARVARRRVGCRRRHRQGEHGEGRDACAKQRP